MNVAKGKKEANMEIWSNKSAAEKISAAPSSLINRRTRLAY